MSTYMSPALSTEQEAGIDFILINQRKSLLALAGPAGSGKTTLIKILLEKLEGEVTICAPTNKAAHVLRTKGIESAITFHQACMRPVFRPPMDKLGAFLEQPAGLSQALTQFPAALVAQFGRAVLESALETARTRGIYTAFRELGIRDMFKYIERWKPAEPKGGRLIVDEASMINSADLDIAKKVFGQIILIGDEFQLPPVKGEPEFWNVPDRFALTEVHRQAEGSQPLLIATAIRRGESVQMESLEDIDIELCRAGSPVIVWRNKTREALTSAIREGLGYAGQDAQPGEILICRNARDRDAKQRGFINNSLWKVLSSGHGRCVLENDEGEQHSLELYCEELGEGYGIPFRFAYAITAHSAQGSQWDEVQIHYDDAALYDRLHPEESKKWLYTAVTRAAKRVHWVTDEVGTSA